MIADGVKCGPEQKDKDANPLLAAVFRSGSTAVQEHYLWPCNVALWGVWQHLQTQWRMGMGGATGLDYAGVRAWLDDSAPELPEGTTRRDVWAALQACERAALGAWAESKQQGGA